MYNNKILCGDALTVLKGLPDKLVNCVVTSPPYFNLRDYGIEGQIGLEDSPELYVERLVNIFREVKRVLRDDGTVWLNLGDSYNGSGKAGNNPEYQKKHTAFGKLEAEERFGKPTKVHGLKPKDLIGIPWMTAFALRSDGWYLRSDIIWSKSNPMPSSVKDRCTTSHEYVFMLTKSKKYFYDADAIAEDCVWVENRPAGIVRDREYGYDSKTNNNPEAYKRKKGPQTFGGKKAREGQAEGGDPRNGHRTDENSQWGKEWNSDNPKKNKRSVWSIATRAFKGAHFATFPEKLVEPCILAGCPVGGLVLDPFIGSGTTAAVAKRLGRNYLGIELNPEYITIAEDRISKVVCP